ncbi:MAG: Crp/Fnr family transcriptional regulator [Sphingobacteriales bacterium]|nr:MAG: Crp/Fnr family transcriptional regulator [Sphingobacteriales bacterium]
MLALHEVKETRQITPKLQFELSEIENLRLAGIGELRTIPKQSVIYRPGDAADCIYLVKQGRVKIINCSNEGKEVIKSIVQSNEIFGEMSLAGNARRNDFAKAMNQEVKLYVIPYHALMSLLNQYPELSLKFITQLGNRLIHADRRLETLVFKDARSRIVEFLQESAASMGIKVGYEVLLKQFLTHQEIANITATSRQTVTTVLNDLKKLNLIYIYRKNILIRDVSMLQ